MINFNGCYANVFDVEVKDNYVKAHLSTSRKDQNDEYINSNWFGYFFGKAKDKAAKLEDKSRIFIIQGGVTCEKYEDNEGESKYFTSVKVFDFVTLESNSGGSKKSTKKKKSADIDDDEEDEAPKKPAKKTAKKPAKKKVPEYDEDDEDDDDDDVPF